MGIPTGEVQTAAIAKCRNDATLQGLLGNPSDGSGNTFDQGSTPPDQPCPYLELFPITTQKGGLFVMGLDASDVYQQVTAFTKSGDFIQARAIMKRVYSLLDQQSLTLANGFTNPMLLFQNEQELFDSAQGKQQVVHRYKVSTQG
jgi:hypothetical protein